MTDPIRRLRTRVRQLLAPGSGKRRAGAYAVPELPPFNAVMPMNAPAEKLCPDPVSPETSPLVRPYLVRHEQKMRREALEAALIGIDLGPTVIHGVRVMS